VRSCRQAPDGDLLDVVRKNVVGRRQFDSVGDSPVRSVSPEALLSRRSGARLVVVLFENDCALVGFQRGASPGPDGDGC